MGLSLTPFILAGRFVIRYSDDDEWTVRTSQSIHLIVEVLYFIDCWFLNFLIPHFVIFHWLMSRVVELLCRCQCRWFCLESYRSLNVIGVLQQNVLKNPYFFFSLNFTGAIFSEEQKHSHIELAFKYAVHKINRDRVILPKTTLVYDIQYVPKEDSFHATKKGKRKIYSYVLVQRTIHKHRNDEFHIKLKYWWCVCLCVCVC